MTIMMALRLLLSSFTLLALLVPCRAQEETCENDGSCGSRCNLPESFCQQQTSASSSLYANGGTAMAYKPNQPLTSTVCDFEQYKDSRHRVATWMFSRSSQRHPPAITLKTNLLSCAPEKDACCCRPLLLENNSAAQVEVWQTRPDGTYSSLGSDDGTSDCRARMNAGSSSGAVFETVAPGSVGAMGGLGYDTMPYGPPVIHILVSAANHAPVLIDLPVVVTSSSLQAGSFRGPDVRGVAWVREVPNNNNQKEAYEITSWKSDAKSNRVELEVDIFMQQHDDDANDDLASALCPSMVYGLPSSFFLEPISVCAPSMLNFFEL